jgi:hypothetical protein
MRAPEERRGLHDIEILRLLDERVRRIAQEVLAAMEQPRETTTRDAASEELRARLARIRAKEFISVGEAALLLSCSDGHVRNLVKRAKKRETDCPIPFRDLDGIVVFKIDDLLAWSEQPKTKVRRAGKKVLPPEGGTSTLPCASLRAATPRKEQVR